MFLYFNTWLYFLLYLLVQLHNLYDLTIELFANQTNYYEILMMPEWFPFMVFSMYASVWQPHILVNQPKPGL